MSVESITVGEGNKESYKLAVAEVAAASAESPAVVALKVAVVSQDGSDDTLGATTDAAASSVDAESATARTGISLWKGIKNVLLLIKTALNGGLPAALGIGGGLKSDDNGPSWTPVLTYTTSADITTAAAISAAPTSGQKVVADDILLSSAVDCLFTLQEETSATVLANVKLTAGIPCQITLRSGLRVPTADKKLFGKASAAGNVYVTVIQHSIA